MQSVEQYRARRERFFQKPIRCFLVSGGHMVSFHTHDSADFFLKMIYLKGTLDEIAERHDITWTNPIDKAEHERLEDMDDIHFIYRGNEKLLRDALDKQLCEIERRNREGRLHYVYMEEQPIWEENPYFLERL